MAAARIAADQNALLSQRLLNVARRAALEHAAEDEIGVGRARSQPRVIGEASQQACALIDHWFDRAGAHARVVGECGAGGGLGGNVDLRVVRKKIRSDNNNNNDIAEQTNEKNGK